MIIYFGKQYFFCLFIALQKVIHVVYVAYILLFVFCLCFLLYFRSIYSFQMHTGIFINCFHCSDKIFNVLSARPPNIYIFNYKTHYFNGEK